MTDGWSARRWIPQKIIYWASILITIIGGKAAEGEEGEGAGEGGEEENDKKKMKKKKKKEMDGK